MGNANYELADIGTRFLALLIDGVILGLIGAVLFGAGGNTGGLVSFVIGLAYYGYFLTQQDGQTPGKRIMKVRVIKTSGEPLTFTDVLIRYVGYYINTALLFIGWLWAFFDSESQGLHDKLASTYVVRAD
jgi:uncharacterized RDD family membrane protein YckC